jgi:hypothetical protein
VPLAAIIQVVVQDVVIPWRRNRLELAEAEYAVGPPAPMDGGTVEPSTGMTGAGAGGLGPGVAAAAGERSRELGRPRG